MKRYIKINGVPTSCRISRTEDGYVCEIAQDCHYAEAAVYANCGGTGETEREAIDDFLRRCGQASHART